MQNLISFYCRKQLQLPTPITENSRISWVHPFNDPERGKKMELPNWIFHQTKHKPIRSLPKYTQIQQKRRNPQKEIGRTEMGFCVLGFWSLERAELTDPGTYELA